MSNPATTKTEPEPLTEADLEELDRDAWPEIEQALAEADAGAPSAPHDAVKAWLRSLGTPDELPPPIPLDDD